MITRVSSLVFAIVIGFTVPAFGANTSATIEDIARLVHERKMKELNKIPLTGFYLISAHGSAKEVQAALNAGADSQRGDPAHGDTPPITLAAGINQDPKVLGVLVKAGADINHTGKNYHRTPLHQAVLFNPKALPMLKALLENGANIYILDINEKTALDYAISGTLRNEIFDGKPREDIMLLLLQAGKTARYPFSSPEKAMFYTRKYRLYTAAFEYGENGGKTNSKVVKAFKDLGVDVMNEGSVKPTAVVN